MKKKVMLVVVMMLLLNMGMITNAMGKFDPVYYATVYSDVANALGTDENVLYSHYLNFGQKEGRFPYEGAMAGEQVDGIKNDSSTQTLMKDELPNADIVPIDKLQNYASLRGKMTDTEFQMAYNEALKIVQPLVGMSREEQAKQIMTILRGMVDNGSVSYSTNLPHYNNAYGYFVNHAASCAGSTRTTGLCLNMLGINYEHVHENQWCHQWCRADINGTTWVIDPYAYTCTVEAYPYWHPLANCGK